MVYSPLFIFLIGLTIGSFLNVLIVRLPKEEDTLWERSRCPSCQTLIKWYQNIPLVSFMALRGRCASCRVRISFIYPTVELISGMSALWLIGSPSSVQDLFRSVLLFSVFSVFLCHFIIDVRHKILPDGLNLYLAILFLLNGIFLMDWKFSLIGGAIGFALPWLIAQIFYMLKGVAGLGGGDIKLYGALGLYLGPIVVVQNIFLSSLIGSIFGGILILTRLLDKKDPIPFGPFIIIVAALQIFFPSQYRMILSGISLF